MTIKEVSLKFGLSEDTLRWYEKKGLIGPIQRNSGGIRDYKSHDLRRIEFIKCMRDADLPVDVLKRYIDLYERGDSTAEERKKLLTEQRDLLKERIKKMNEAYKRLDYKIRLYYEGKLDEYLEATGKGDDGND